MFNQMAIDRGISSKCESIIDFNNELYCNDVEFSSNLKDPSLLSVENSTLSNSKILKSDHVYPGLNPDAPLAILYSRLRLRSFERFHRLLSQLADEGRIQYVFRHFSNVCLII